MKPTTVTKAIKPGYQVGKKDTNRATIHTRRTDAGGEFEVYDLYDDAGRLMAKNRYVYVSNNVEKPYQPLNKEEQDIINPPVSEKPDPEPKGK